MQLSGGLGRFADTDGQRKSRFAQHSFLQGGGELLEFFRIIRAVDGFDQRGVVVIHGNEDIARAHGDDFRQNIVRGTSLHLNHVQQKNAAVYICSDMVFADDGVQLRDKRRPCRRWNRTASAARPPLRRPCG